MLCLSFGVLGVLFSLTLAEVFHVTGDAEFCIKCHVMEPMVESYENDVHGGKNKNGVQASCVDCHLPHDTVVHYIAMKTKTSMNDIWVNVMTDTDKIDWEERRSHREHFTYESGCLDCHKNLEEATMSNMKAFLPHRDYFRGATNATCIFCHENVGHKNLGLYLKMKE